MLGESVGELVGGRWAVSLAAYAINAPINIAAISSNAAASLAGAQWWQWLAVSVIGYLAFGAVLLLAHLTVFRNRTTHPVPVAWVVLLGAAAGGARGMVVALLAQSWGLAPAQPSVVLARVLTGLVLGAVLWPLASLMLASIGAYREQRSQLVDDLRLLHAELMRDRGATAELQVALLDSVREELDSVERTRDPAIAREVSHRIWDAAAPPLEPPRMRWSSVLLASVQRNPFATWPVAGIWVLSGIGTLVVAIGWQRAVAQLAFSVVAIAIAFALGRAHVRRHAGSSIAAFVIVMLALVVITGPVASLLFDPRPWPAGAGLVLANALWLPFLAVCVGFIAAALRSSEEVLADLRSHVTEDEVAALAVHDERERLRRELATQLHGTVQSRLLAASAAPRDSVLAASLLADLASAVGGEQTGGDLAPRSLRERLDEVVRPWTALMQVGLAVDGRIDAAVADAVVRVVEEALANAYRHGGATAVTVVVALDGGQVVVTVADDGRGADGSVAGHRAGMGTALLDALAPGWQRQPGPTGGAALTARLKYQI